MIDPVMRLKELVLGAAAGVYPPRQFRIGQLTNVKRFPELAELRSKDLQQVPAWLQRRGR